MEGTRWVPESPNSSPSTDSPVTSNAQSSCPCTFGNSTHLTLPRTRGTNLRLLGGLEPYGWSLLLLCHPVNHWFWRHGPRPISKQGETHFLVADGCVVRLHCLRPSYDSHVLLSASRGSGEQGKVSRWCCWSCEKGVSHCMKWKRNHRN